MKSCINSRTTWIVSYGWALYIVTRIASLGIPRGCERMSNLVQNQDFGKEEKFEANFGFGERF